MEAVSSEIVSGLQAAIPFNNHLGLRYTQVSEGTAVVLLPDDAALANHIGTQHAAGMFAAGEAASGGAFVGTFSELMGSVVPLAEKAEIAYKKIATGEITATATLTESRDEILARLEADGRARFPVTIDLSDASGTTVAEMTVHWYIKKMG
ncbi:MAG TPA: DUF4442 domain-containing protein [Actinomycetota bacterium]|nr:DUF4442 domain-containing protein [Actinomycetota bacterium]